jgi:hypothetical protein
MSHTYPKYPKFVKPAFIVAELEAQHRRELSKISDFAFVFLGATNGNIPDAERLADDFIDLVFESGVLSTWRYRLLLAAIREGL